MSERGTGILPVNHGRDALATFAFGLHYFERGKE